MAGFRKNTSLVKLVQDVKVFWTTTMDPKSSQVPFLRPKRMSKMSKKRIRLALTAAVAAKTPPSTRGPWRSLAQERSRLGIRVTCPRHSKTTCHLKSGAKRCDLPNPKSSQPLKISSSHSHYRSRNPRNRNVGPPGPIETSKKHPRSLALHVFPSPKSKIQKSWPWQFLFYNHLARFL